MTVFAHAGHWLTSLLYVAPVVIIGVALGVSTWRERRRKARDGSVPPP